MSHWGRKRRVAESMLRKVVGSMLQKVAESMLRKVAESMLRKVAESMLRKVAESTLQKAESGVVNLPGPYKFWDCCHNYYSLFRILSVPLQTKQLGRLLYSQGNFTEGEGSVQLTS
jgi:hypothetical protein